jgi:hypothetical protein
VTFLQHNSHAARPQVRAEMAAESSRMVEALQGQQAKMAALMERTSRYEARASRSRHFLLYVA